MDDSDRQSALRAELVKRLGRERYELWLGPQTTLEYSEPLLRVGCLSSFELQWLRRRIHAYLAECCHIAYGQGVSVEYFICPAGQNSFGQTTIGQTTTKMLQKSLLADEAERESPGVATCVAEPSAAQARERIVAAEAVNIPSKSSERPRPRNSALARHSFANFVSGAGNELGCRTAEKVAERLGHYGPLLLHGPPGVGKTHLLYAMLRHLRQQSPNYRAQRVSAEQFTTEFLESLRQRTLPGFRQKYRSVDVLLIDDIQFIVSKRATLEELLVTIDFLHERGKQVVLTCDCTPQELLKASSELAMRVSGGLAVPLELPDFATRRGLVRRFIDDMHPVIGLAIDEETITVIATQVAGSARQLQGAINRLIVTSDAMRKPLTADYARTILTEYVQQITPSVRLGDIKRAVCLVFGVDASSLKSTSKARKVAEPRMLAMWLACSLTRSALGEISEYFGRRSHSTVISAQKKIERMVSRGETIAVENLDCPVEEAIRKVRQALRSA